MTAIPSPPHPVTRSRRWIWFFLLLGALAVGLLSLEIGFNLYQQLTPAKLAEARERWNANGPRDYTAEYAIKREYNPDPVQGAPQKYTVRVREGQVESVTGPDGKAPPPGEFEFGSMNDLFGFIERQLQVDQHSDSGRPFVKADFDPRDGHISHYVHSVSKTRERLEVSVQLRAVTASSP